MASKQACKHEACSPQAEKKGEKKEEFHLDSNGFGSILIQTVLVLFASDTV